MVPTEHSREARFFLELNVPPCMFAYDGQDDGSGGIGVHPHETAVAPAMRRSTHALIEAFVLPVLRGDAAVFVRARESRGFQRHLRDHARGATWQLPTGVPAWKRR